MGQKRTPALVSKAKQLRADGRSFAEVAAELSKGGRSVSKAAVMGWLKDSSGASAAVAVPPPAGPVAAPTPLDESDVDADFVVKTLRGLVKRERDREARFTAAKDDAGAQRAGRLAGQFAMQLAKLQAKDDEDGDVVKVRAADVRAAADRGLLGLHKLVESVASERATWPRCDGCGQPCGEFVPSDKSPLRSLVERLFGRLP